MKLTAARSEFEAEAIAAGNGQSEILLAHKIILEDPQLVTEAENLIGRGKSAAWAWQTAAQACEESVKSLKSGLLAGRASDIQDVSQRTALPSGRGEAATA